MEGENSMDIGKGMIYCDVHKYWRSTGSICEECEDD